MASKEELSEQLTLTTKLAAQVERMAAAVDRIERSYETQISAVEKLANAFSQINTQNTINGLDNLNKTLQETQQKMKDTGKASESTFQTLGKKVEETGKTISQRFPKSITIAVAALSGFAQGVRNIIGLGKGITGFVTGFVDGLTNITASIIAIPFKIFQGLFDMAVKSAGGSNELAEAIEKLRKQFGELYGPSNKTIVDTSKNLKGFSDTGLNAWRVFGNLAQRLNEIRELAEKMGPTFNQFLKEFQDNGGALLAYQKGLGLSAEEMKNLGVMAKVTGQRLSGVAKDFTKFSKSLSDSETDAKLLSRDMGKMAGDVKHFGSLGAKELSEVALYARKLGIEVDKMTSTLDAFETFDTAAENASKLAQAFGANIDAFRLMEAQNPAEQFDELRKAMFAVGKTSDSMSRQELKLLAQTTGMDEQTAKLAFSMHNQGQSLDEIKKKSGDAEKRTLTQAQAMNKLADAIERMTPQGGMNFTSFWDAFIKGFTGGIQASKEFREIMINIQRSVRLVYQEGVKLGKAFVELFPGVKQFLQGIADFFKPAKFKSLVGGVVDILTGFMKDLQNPTGKASFANLMDKLKEKFFDFFDTQSPTGRKMLEGFKTVFKTITKLMSEGIKWASDKVGEGISYITDLITGKKKLGDLGGASGELGFLGPIFEQLGEAVKHAWVAIAPKLWELVKILGTKLFDYLKSEEFMKIVRPAMPIIAAVLFGPAFTRALVGAGTAALVKGTAGIVGSLGKKLLSEVAEKTSEISSTSKAVKIGDKLPPAGDAQDAIKSGKALEKGGSISWSSVLKFLVGFAGVVAIGMAGVFASIALIRKFNVSAKELTMGIAMVGSAALAMLPTAAALALISKFPIDPASAAVGIAAIGLSVMAMVGVLALAYVALKKLDLSKLKTISEIMWDMSKVFLAVSAVVAIAMGIGAVILSTAGVGAVALAAGLGAMTAGIGMMAGAAILIMKQLNDVPMGAGFKDKVDAFAKVMDSITGFAKNLSTILEAVKPSFISLIKGKDDTIERINSVKLMIEALIGKPGGAGIIGIMETIMSAMSQMSNGGPRMLEGARLFADLLNATATLAGAMKPPDKLFESIDGFWTTAGDVNTALDKVTKFASNVTTGVSHVIDVFVKKVMPLVTGGNGLSDQQIKGAAAIGQLLGAVTQIAQNMTPSQGVIQAMRDQVGGTVGRDDFVLKPENMQALGGIIDNIASGLTRILPSVIGALNPLLQTIGTWHFSDSDAAAMKTVGPLLQQMILMVQSVTAQSSQLAQAKVPGTDVKSFIDKIGDVVPGIFKSMSEKMPEVFDGIKNGVSRLQKDVKPETLRAGIDIFKSVAEVVTEIPKLAQQLSGANTGAFNPAAVAKSLNEVGAFMNDISGKGGGLSTMAQAASNMKNYAKALTNNGLAPALESVAKMVAAVNELNAALGDPAKIDIKTKLSNIASAVGLGGKANYTINPSRNVVINVNMSVEINAADMEKALVMRGSSVIRNRINWMMNNPSEQATPELPTSPIENLPDAQKR